MIRIIPILVVVFSLACSWAFGQDASPTPSTALAAAEEAETMMVKDPSFVPPTWLQDVLLSLKSLPVIGPIIIQVLQWLGVLLTILTTLTASAIVILRALMRVLTFAQLFDWVNKIEDFEKNSPILYWLKYFSAFNAPEKRGTSR